MVTTITTTGNPVATAQGNNIQALLDALTARLSTGNTVNGLVTQATQQDAPSLVQFLTPKGTVEVPVQSNTPLPRGAQVEVQVLLNVLGKSEGASQKNSERSAEKPAEILAQITRINNAPVPRSSTPAQIQQTVQQFTVQSSSNTPVTPRSTTISVPAVSAPDIARIVIADPAPSRVNVSAPSDTSPVRPPAVQVVQSAANPANFPITVTAQVVRPVVQPAVPLPTSALPTTPATPAEPATPALPVAPANIPVSTTTDVPALAKLQVGQTLVLTIQNVTVPSPVSPANPVIPSVPTVVAAPVTTATETPAPPVAAPPVPSAQTATVATPSSPPVASPVITPAVIAPPSPSTPTLTGVVIGTEQSGEAVLESPVGLLKITSPVPLVKSSEVQFTIAQVNSAPASPAINTPPQAAQALTETLEDILQLLTGAMPVAGGAAAKAATQLLPQPDAQFIAKTLWFLANVQSEDAGAWLGSDVRKSLEQNGRNDLISKLQNVFSALKNTGATNPSAQNQTTWQPYYLPVYDGAQVQVAQAYIKREYDEGDGKSGKQKKPVTRFVVDVEMSVFGPIQLDGFMRYPTAQTAENIPPEFHLRVKTKTPLPPEMITEMQQLFYDSLSAYGVAGAMEVQTTDVFMTEHQPTDEPINTVLV